MTRLGSKLTYANVISTVCLFILLGGGAYAATGLPGRQQGTLASGETERGVYGLAGVADLPQDGFFFPPSTVVSYPIPLNFEPRVLAAVTEDDEEDEACPGSVAKPAAAPGYLCLYEAPKNLHGHVYAFTEPRPGHYGFKLFFEAKEGKRFWGSGTWAVTAP
jgi:hypothetical protein